MIVVVMTMSRVVHVASLLALSTIKYLGRVSLLPLCMTSTILAEIHPPLPIPYFFEEVSNELEEEHCYESGPTLVSHCGYHECPFNTKLEGIQTLIIINVLLWVRLGVCIAKLIIYLCDHSSR